MTREPEQKLAIVRMIAAVLRARRLVLASVLGCMVIAAALGWMRGRRWRIDATIEIALRTATEPLENEVLARERLRGIIERRKTESGLDLEVRVQNRYKPTDQRITRLIDIEATSVASAEGRALIDASLAEFVAAHKEKRVLEQALLAQEKMQLEAVAEQVRMVLEARGDESLQRESEEKTRRKPSSLSEALIAIHRRTFEIGRLIGTHRFPDTRVIEPTTAPRRSLNPVIIYALAGGLIGGLLAALILLFRGLELRRPQAAPTPPTYQASGFFLQR